jgi:hypothetical protein
MVLCGQLFLPNLRKLQDIDAHEGGLPSHLFGESYGHHLRNILEPHQELLRERAGSRAAPKKPNSSQGQDYP